MHLIEDHAEKSEIPVRFAASKVMEGDEKILQQLGMTDHENHILEEIFRCDRSRNRIGSCGSCGADAL